jgi:hypothetical protein
MRGVSSHGYINRDEPTKIVTFIFLCVRIMFNIGNICSDNEDTHAILIFSILTTR